MYLVIVHHIWTTIVAVGHLSNKLRLKGKPLSLYSKRCTRLRPIHHSSVMSIATFDRVAVAILDVSPVVITMLGGIDDGFRRCLAELLPPGFARDVTRWRYPLTSLHELSPRHTKKKMARRVRTHTTRPRHRLRARKRCRRPSQYGTRDKLRGKRNPSKQPIQGSPPSPGTPRPPITISGSTPT